MSVVFECRDIVYKIGEKNILSIQNLKIESALTCFVGASGIGKTTFFKLICGLNQFSSHSQNSGEIQWNSKFVMNSQTSSEELRELRHEHILFFDQDLIFVNHWTIEQNIDVALDHQNVPQILELLTQLKLDSSVLKKYPQQLSGGEKQKINILIAILARQSVLLFDEPTAHLDTQSVQLFLNLIEQKLKNKKIIAISHDNRFISYFKNIIQFGDVNHV